MTKTTRRHHRAFLAEIERRGGETGIDHAPHQGCAASRTQWRELQIVSAGRSEGRKVWLLRAEGWRYYSRRYGSSPARLAYLCGYDDNGPWAARVPGTCETAADAVRWLVPATVLKARAAGRRVLRQGDVYAIETTKWHDGLGLTNTTRIGPDPRELDWPWHAEPPYGPHGNIEGHEWHRRARVLIHSDPERPHAPLRVPFPARFVAQRAYEMGRGGRRGAAD